MLLLLRSRTARCRAQVSLIVGVCLMTIGLRIDTAEAKPLQFLPHVPGFIPVFIRHGDEPLANIDPTLAEAFHESTGIVKNVREIKLDREPMIENSKQSHQRVPLSHRVRTNNVARKQLLFYHMPSKAQLINMQRGLDGPTVQPAIMKVPKH